MTASLRVDCTGYVPGDNICVDVEVFDGSGNGIDRSFIQLSKVWAR